VGLRQKVQLEFEHDGGTRQVVTEYSAVDLRAWEGEHHKSALNTPMSVSMLTWLGHHAAVRQGQINGDLKTYQAFDQACLDVQGVADPGPTRAGEKGRAKATRKAASADSSAP
jgi:hypothetical protein